MDYRAKVIADSIGPNGVRLTTMEFDIWKPLLAEFNTHGLLSRNFPSSRAIPWSKMRKKIIEKPHVPMFRKNNPGMQPGDPLSQAEQEQAAGLWLLARDEMLVVVEEMGSNEADKDGNVGLNIHKQWLNRLLEPWITVTGLVTATEWDNFFNLRLELNDDGYPMAQDEFYFTALAMKKALDESEPKQLGPGGIHAPYIDASAIEWVSGFVTDDDPSKIKKACMMLSAGKCATVSYDNLGQGVDHEKDYRRAVEMLLPNGHMSVFQHQAICLPGEVIRGMSGAQWSESTAYDYSGQLRGWTQFRKTLPGEGLWASPRSGVQPAITIPELLIS